MRRGLPWWLAALGAAALVFAAGTLVSMGAPPSFLHPDEQTAALPAQAIAGARAPLPEDLAPWAPAFEPLRTKVHGGDTGVSTGLLAVGGVGFGYPLLLAPFYLFGEAAPYLSGALSLALLYLGALLVLDGRRAVSYPLAALVLAAPPVMLQAGLLFSNLPGLAFAVLGLGLLAEARRSGRARLIPGAVLSLAVAAAMRVDYVVAFLLAVPVGLLALLPAARPGRRARLALGWGVAALACVGTALLAFWYVNGTWGIPYLHAPGQASTNATTVRDAWERVRSTWAEGEALSSPDVAALSAQNYLFAFVPGLLALGLLHALRPSRRADEAWIVLPLAAQGLVVWLFTGATAHYGTGCPCVDGSHPRYFLPIYASFALLGALLARDVLDRLPARALRAAAATAVAGLVVTAGVAHAWHGEQGIAWVRHMKEFHDLYEEAAKSLPEEAVVSGNYLSKIVRARPVLVPDRTRDYPQVVTDVVASGHPVYVDAGWLVPGKDEHGQYGVQLLRSNHHYLVHSGVKDFYEVKPTNATVRQVFDLFPGEWAPARDGAALQALAEPAHFRAVDRPDGSLPQHGPTLRDARVVMTWLDDEEGRVVRAGYTNFDSNSTVELAAWRGAGTGTWVETKFDVKKGLVVTGAMWLSGNPTVKRLEVGWP